MKTFKKTLCLVLVVVMAISLFAVAASAKSLNDYSDASKVSSEYKTAVDFDTQLGVLRGVSDTTYSPDGYLTRAQLATIIYRITTGDVTDKYVKNYANGSTFSDVKSTDWFAGYVNYAADNGYLKGVGADKYAPNSYLTGYQAMAALLRAIGYDANNEFVGKDWTLAVTKAAKDSGINAGIVADWAGPISREVTAQLIKNTLFTQKVSYSPLFGYSSLFQSTLARDVFGIVSGKDGEIAIDKFGNPKRVWYDNKGKEVVSIYDSVVKTYTKAVSGCDILVDVGIPKTDLTTAAVLTFRTLQGEHTMPLTHRNLDCEKIYFGGNGVLTQVYTNGYDAQGRLMVIISETAYYLAQVTKAASATHGAASGAEATVFGPEPTGWTKQLIDSNAYAVGSYILVTAPYGQRFLDISNVNGRPTLLPVDNYVLTDITWTVCGTPTTFTGKLTSVTSNGIPGGGNVTTFKIDGKDYEFSYKKYYDYVTNLAIGGTYTFFLDAYGYIIGVAPYAAPQSYGVIDRMYYQTNGFDAGAGMARVVYMDASKGEMQVKSIDGDKVINGDFYQPGYANVSQDYTQNGRYYEPLYNLTSGAIVEQEHFHGRIDVVKGNARLGRLDGYTIYTKNTTVFLYKTVDNSGNAVYTSYTGYNAAPSANGARVWFVDVKADASNHKFVDYVFVDATANGLVDSGSGKYIVTNEKWFSATNEGGATVYSYKVYDMTGKEVVIKSTDDELFDDVGINAVSFNQGLAVSATENTDYITIGSEDTYVGTVFVDNNNGHPAPHYDLDGKDVYVVSASGVTAAAATDAIVKAALVEGNWIEFVRVNGAITAYYIFTI